MERLRHVHEGRSHRTAQVLRKQHAAHGLPFFLRVLDVVAQAHGHVAQLTHFLGDALNGGFHGARVQPLRTQPGIGVNEAGQHAAHVLAVAVDAFAVNQALQCAVVVLCQLQVGLESLVLRLAALAFQSQHGAEHLQAFRGDALEQLECLLAHGALRHGRALKHVAHLHGHLIGFANTLEHTEILALAIGIHHVHRVFTKARQRRIALFHQLSGRLIAIDHRIVDIHQAVGHIRVGAGFFLQGVHHQVKGILQTLLLQHHGAHTGKLIAQQAQHVGAGRHVQAAVDGSAGLLVQTHLLVAQLENFFQLFLAPDNTWL